MNLEILKREVESDPENIENLFRYAGLLRRYGLSDPDLASIIAESAYRLGISCIESKDSETFVDFLQMLIRHDRIMYIEMLYRSRKFIISLELHWLFREAVEDLLAWRHLRDKFPPKYYHFFCHHSYRKHPQ